MMLKFFWITVVLGALALPFTGLAQVTITGRVLNQADTKPLANVNVFLSNATVGDKTTSNGTFRLSSVKPGKYDLVVSIVGFDTYKQSIIVGSANITIPDILIFPKTFALREVKIVPKTDPSRAFYYDIFKKEFLGQSDFAKDCRILNPEMLDFAYDDKESNLTASSADFLVIENQALGYRIKYLLANFTAESKDEERQMIHYEGSSLFENLEGTAPQKREWQKRRQEVYEGSPKHFLQAVLNNHLEEEGFRVLQYAIYQNPQRPSDEIIDSKIKYFKELKIQTTKTSDSLLSWEKKKRLKKTLTALMKYQLNKNDLVKLNDKGTYALSCENDALHITYSKNRRFSTATPIARLNSPYNNDVTLLTFNEPSGYFDDNGVYLNPNAIVYSGAWTKRRIAELLPSDYEPPNMVGREASLAKGPDDKLEDYKSTHITEQAYLYFDKPYYAAGDTIYFKAYVTVGERHELSALSGVLHVDMVNTQNKVDQSLFLKINGGVCWGDFALPDTLPKGEYRVRAYTKWMRNDGDAGFFSQTIPVGSALQTKIAESATRQPAASKPDLQFFPEGGALVSGVKSKIGFKAIGFNGLGLDVKGTITDNTGNTVTTFASVHLGMGSVDITPETGKSYKANVTFADGSQNTIDLPPPLQQGIALSVNNDSLQKTTVFINADKPYFEQNRDKAYQLVIYSGGIITSVNCRLDSATLKFDLAKRRLHTGVNTVTLFSAAGAPLAERLFFVQNYDKLNLAVSSDKTIYAAREKVNIKINAKNRADSTVAGHFSVSITDETKVPVDENTEKNILNSLLLTDDLKGNVEQPGYYFSNISNETLKNLDLVMLTHGYRRFEWKEVINSNRKPPAYQPETGLEISGIANSMGGKPLKNGMVSLIRTAGGNIFSDTTDDKGNFKFKNLAFLDSTRFMLQAVTKEGSNKTQLIYKTDTIPTPTSLLNFNADVNQQITAYIKSRKEQLNEYAKYGSPKGIMLREVKVKEQKAKDNYRSSALGGPGHADQVVHMDDIPMGGELSERLKGRLRGIKIENRPGRSAAYFMGDAMLIVVDGVLMPGNFDFNSLSNDVETVEVLKTASSAGLYGNGAGHGVLVFTTKIGKPRDLKDIPSFGILPITPRGYYLSRVFYSPRYDNSEVNLKRPDLRSTIYWNPEVITAKDGNASVDFYNADKPGTYRLVIEGIDEKGNLGRQVFRYTVQ
ncbi:TonB-dependent receptor [Mucilaginibacter flavidus]|uniref:TonB-dependent receptor n=1 Tax=Mucilaginibacter flavidus TaxID=2949309 RepID=UPI0020931E4D|nr:carboxypeptidase regulatory-like domain-containing protein [Mucilaginibacter flavidus]MCO5949912.1 carboxypeptidase-like regulatory domain-containing protein [Mucilaginibacter flavidus]